jgi:HK97 family phage prohead protease
MELPAGLYLKPVEGDDDLFGFAIGGKALTDESITVEENGDLIIEGYAAVWDGEDREGENFAPGAFERASKAFIESGGPLCYHHKADHQLGQVTYLREDDKGLQFKARVDGVCADDPKLKRIYHQIKNKTLRGVSVGGFFKRALIEGKRKIADMDFTEISVTGVPMHTGPSFAVVAGKALTSELRVPAAVKPDEEVIRDADFREIQWALDTIDSILTKVGRRGKDDSESDPTGSDLAVAV